MCENCEELEWKMRTGNAGFADILTGLTGECHQPKREIIHTEIVETIVKPREME